MLHLLTEIRDNQREHLELYRSFTAKALEAQEQSIKLTQQAVRRQWLGLAIVLVGIGYLVWLHL
jgi:hypothetical protein